MISEREITFQMAALKDLVRMAKNTALWNTLVIIIGSALQITGNAKELVALIKELQGQKNANNNTQDIEQFAKELKEGFPSIFKI